jgi:hypothetical protein
MTIESIVKTVNKNYTPQKENLWKKSCKASKIVSVENWNDRSFLTYYAAIYYKIVGKEYIINWASDLAIIKMMRSDFAKYFDNSKVKFKDFLDWTLENKDLILSRNNSFILHDLRDFINTFVSNNNIPIKTFENDKFFMINITNRINNGMKMIEFLSIYGIPICYTYLSKQKKINNNIIERSIGIQLSKIDNIDILRKIARQSIIMSPYNENFVGLDWRTLYSDYWAAHNFHSEKWWRSEDYTGCIPEHYNELITS